MPTHDPNHPQDSKDPNAKDWAKSTEAGDFMGLHQSSDPESRKIGYEVTDANVRDTALFLVVMGAALAVVFVLAFGIGKLIYMELGREDGPTNKWAQMSGVKTGGNLVSDPAIEQRQLSQLVKRFPTPRLQTDDGAAEVGNMHAREDMLLNYYSWVNEQQQTVRIPITRAMELLAQRGLPVEGQADTSAASGKGAKTDTAATASTAAERPMFGDGSTAVTVPLTDGFARTGPELQMIYTREQRLATDEPRNTQADLHPVR